MKNIKKNKQYNISKLLSATLIIIFLYISSVSLLKPECFFDDPGFLWHLKNGKNIIHSFSIPTVDTFLSLQRVWISDQWLADIILYAFYATLGFKSIFYLFAFLCFLFIFIFYRKKCLLPYSNHISSLVTTLFIMLYCKIHFIARPVFFSFCLIICLVYLLEKYKSSKTKRETNLINFYLFILFVLYANVHPSFFIAFFIWGMFCVESFIKNFKRFEYKKYILTSLVIFFATCLNPYGLSLHSSILFLNNSEFFMKLNKEWQSVEVFSEIWLLSTLAISLISLFFIFSKNYRKKVGFAYFICTLVFYVYSMKHIRGITYFSIICAIPLSVVINNILKVKIPYNIYMVRLLPVALRRINVYLKHDRYFYITIALFFLTLFYKNYNNVIDFRPNIKIYPYKVASFINNNNFDGNIVASPDYGGFLIWHLNSVKPVIDDRNTLLGEQAYKDYIKAMKSPYSMKLYTIKQNANLILVPKRSRAYKSYLKNSAFRVIFKEENFVLFKVNDFN